MPSLNYHFEELFSRHLNSALEGANSQIANDLKEEESEFQQIVLSDHITTLNEAIYDFMLENLEKIDEDEEFGMNYENFFYFRKREDDSVINYHLFPQLDTRLIEKPKLMCIKNRV